MPKIILEKNLRTTNYTYEIYKVNTPYVGLKGLQVVESGGICSVAATSLLRTVHLRLETSVDLFFADSA